MLTIFFYLFGGSHLRFSVDVSVLGGFMGFVGELLCWGLFFNKVAGLWPVALLKGGSGMGGYSSGFCEIFGNVFFTEHLLDGCF